MRAVKTIEDARLEWDKFNKKYAHLIQRPEPNLYRSQKISSDFEKKITDNPGAAKNLAMNIQRFFRGRRERDTFTPIHLIGLTPLPGGARPIRKTDTPLPIKKSINRWKLKALKDALDSGDWHAAIFKDKTLPRLALSLFEAEKITDQQLASLLEFHQAIVENAFKGIFRIIDDNGEFTKDAHTQLLPMIQNVGYVKKLGENEMEAFRLLIAALPKSEQIFYITDNAVGTQFGKNLAGLDAMFMSDNSLIQLSRGALDALGITRYGVDEYIKHMLQFGALHVGDIESGVVQHVRYGAIAYPETGELGILHGGNPSKVETTRHDDYHREIMSATPKAFVLGAFGRIVNQIREHTGIAWTKEIWDYRDADFRYFLYFARTISPAIDLENTEQMTRLFCHMMLLGSNEHVESHGGALIRIGELTYIGALTFIDMIQNPDVWRSFKIDPEKFLGIFADHYHRIKEIVDFIKNDDPKIQVLKCFIYTMLKEQGKESDFVHINNLINAQDDHFILRLQFEKIRRNMIADDSHESWINASYVSFDGVPLTRASIGTIKSNIENNQYSDLVFDTPEKILRKGMLIYDSAKTEAVMKIKGLTLMDMVEMDASTRKENFWKQTLCRERKLY